MTGTEIASAIIGFFICAFIVCIVCILVMILIWYTFKKNMDFDDIANMEDPDND